MSPSQPRFPKIGSQHVLESGDNSVSNLSPSCDSMSEHHASSLRPAASRTELPQTCMKQICFWTLDPADGLPGNTHHDAESLARKILQVRKVPTRGDILQLFELLPHEKPPRGSGSGSCFSCGMFAQNTLRGLRVGSRKFPDSARVLTAFARGCAPGHVFTSVNLFCNVRTALHVDSNNDHYANLVAGISSFEGGQILVENPRGRHRMQTSEGSVSADLLEIAGTHALFDAYRLKHETTEWRGSRLVLVAFSVKGSSSLCDEDRAALLDQGFVLPPTPECSTNDPPTVAQVPMKSLPPGLTQRVASRCLGDLFFLELFCGTGGLAAAVKKVGFGTSIGVASRVTGCTKCPVIPMNLLNASQHALLWDMLAKPNLCAVHICPPASDQTIVNLCVDVVSWCHSRGILLTIEGPVSSSTWDGPLGRKCKALGFLKTTLHQCMFGAAHAKHSAIFHNYPEVRRLCLLCDHQHQHAAWDQTVDGPISAYPLAMCQSLARAIRDTLEHAGCSCAPPAVSLSRAAQAATYKQPKGTRMPPLVPARSGLVVLRGPGKFMPATGVLKQFTPIAPEITSMPPVHGLAAGSKCTRSMLYGGWGTDHGPIREMTFAIPHSCDDFVKFASAAEHPRHLYSGVPDVLADCVRKCATTPYVEVGKERTEALRKWTLRAQELREQVDPNPPKGHCAKILEGKDLRLFQEMLDASGHADSHLPSCIREGFHLMGPLPNSGVLQRKSTFATLTPDEVRANAAAVRTAIWNACKGTKHDRVAEEVSRITKEEKMNGWLEGPFFDDIPEGAVLSRRFGVEQTSTKPDGTVVSKVRPIDDFTESQVNLSLWAQDCRS